jgi:hypothetical protein
MLWCIQARTTVEQMIYRERINILHLTIFETAISPIAKLNDFNYEEFRLILPPLRQLIGNMISE